MTKLLETRHFDGQTSGFLGVINAIKWVGFREWLNLCFRWRKVVDEGYIYEWKSGN